MEGLAKRVVKSGAEVPRTTRKAKIDSPQMPQIMNFCWEKGSEALFWTLIFGNLINIKPAEIKRNKSIKKIRNLFIPKSAKE